MLWTSCNVAFMGNRTPYRHPSPFELSNSQWLLKGASKSPASFRRQRSFVKFIFFSAVLPEGYRREYRIIKKNRLSITKSKHVYEVSYMCAIELFSSSLLDLEMNYAAASFSDHAQVAHDIVTTLSPHRTISSRRNRHDVVTTSPMHHPTKSWRHRYDMME